MIWFTADTHFDHDKIILYAKRPWKTTEEMNEALIENWNGVVKKGDVVYHLGDFAFRRHGYFAERLHGSIVLVEGSHDNMTGRDKKAFTMVGPRHTVKANVEYGTPDIILSHYAMRVWPKSHYGTWHLYGHSHGNLPSLGLSFDVGIDPMGYLPVSLPQVALKMVDLQYDAQQDPRYTKVQTEGGYDVPRQT
ncbi:MAG: phosphoesterase [Dehalococcoidia bacterium]|jgi:calcineurin-like phosphoesterase family protein